MKKSFLFIGILSVVLFSCKPKDTREPIIYLDGDSEVSIILGTSYTDPGFTAHDNVDGDLTSAVSVTSTIETSSQTIYGNTIKTGTYAMTYTVADKEGNTGTIDRIVNVVNSSGKFCINYYVDKASIPNPAMFPDYLQQEMEVKFDTKVDGRIILGKLSNKITNIHGDLDRRNYDDLITTNDSIYIYIEPQEKEFDGYIYKVRGIDNSCYFIDTVNLKFTIKYQIDKCPIEVDGTAGSRIATDDVIEI